MLEIKEVITKKQIKEFIYFPLKLYKGNPYFVPPLYADELKMFKKNYMYYDQSEAKFFLAYKDNKVVGRIGAILQFASNQKWNQKRVRFNRFDSIDDIDVAKALFSKVEEYAKEKGMNEIVGPLGFSDLEREGLLIEGFDYLSTFEEEYNYAYYQKLIEKCGYSKEVDWLEHRLFYNEEKTGKVANSYKKIQERFNYHFADVKSTKEVIKKYNKQFFDILDVTYDKLYQTVPFTKGMRKLLIDNFNLIINYKYLPILLNENDEIVAFSISFPAIGEIIQKSNGHLYPLTLIKILHYVKHPKKVDLGLIGVMPNKALTGGTGIIMGYLAEQMKKDNLEYFESNLNLEDNVAILGTWKHFDAIQHKRRRSFIKSI